MIALALCKFEIALWQAIVARSFFRKLSIFPFLETLKPMQQRIERFPVWFTSGRVWKREILPGTGAENGQDYLVRIRVEHGIGDPVLPEIEELITGDDVNEVSQVVGV